MMIVVSAKRQHFLIHDARARLESGIIVINAVAVIGRLQEIEQSRADVEFDPAVLKMRSM